MPLIYLAEGTPFFIKDRFKNQACFYLGGGPSLKNQNIDLLSSRGICTFAVNNIAAWTSFSPTFWCSADTPVSFHSLIWEDPKIIKFAPLSKAVIKYRRETEKGEELGTPIALCPNMYFFNLIGRFNHKTYLAEEEVSWGCDKGVKDSIGIPGGRSVMFVALKLIYYLGFRRVYLLGCDFDMVFGTPYAFAQQKHKGGCSSNNTCYHIMTKRFEALKEQFEKANFKIINCTPNSGLKLFPTMPYEKAVEKEHKKFSKKPTLANKYV